MLALPTHLVEFWRGGLPLPLPLPLLVRLRFLVFVFVFIFDSVLATVSIGQVRQTCLSRRGNTLWHSQVNTIWECQSLCVCVSVCRCVWVFLDVRVHIRLSVTACEMTTNHSQEKRANWVGIGQAKQKREAQHRRNRRVGQRQMGVGVLGDRLQSLLLAHLTKTSQAKWRMRIPNAECEYKWESYGNGMEWIWIVNSECRLRMWMRMRIRMCIELSSYSIP